MINLEISYKILEENHSFRNILRVNDAYYLYNNFHKSNV